MPDSKQLEVARAVADLDPNNRSTMMKPWKCPDCGTYSGLPPAVGRSCVCGALLVLEPKPMPVPSPGIIGLLTELKEFPSG